MTPPVPTTLRLILGDQLNPNHRWYETPRPDVIYVLMEVREETAYVRHHAQKILGIFAAMRDFAKMLKTAGHRVRYVAIDDPSNRHNLIANLEALVAHYGATRVEYQLPDEWRLDLALRQWASGAGQDARNVAHKASGIAHASGNKVQANPPLAITATDSDHFHTTRDEAAQLFKGRKQWLMEHFYRAQRRKHQVLMTADGKPEGGQWNYDQDNRKRWPGTPPEPADTRPVHDHSALWETLVACGIEFMGNPNARQFRWPLNRGEALIQLETFIRHALPHFGDFQDALAHNHWRLFHSLLSFALNVKMLNPREVVQAAEAAWRGGHAPLTAVEGFIRQILGWREYVRGVYWAHMPGYTQNNALNHNRPLPDWFWTGKTRMACMAQAIGQSLDHAYAHHIQRLMVIGNFSLLAGLNPYALHEWYLGIYIDAFEWVEAPNTLGMSQFADDGLLATKPYVSSAAYIDRMGDHCKQCSYDKKAKTGPKACPFNALYWDFFIRHENRLRGNHRLGMVFRNLDKMTTEAKATLTDQARQTLQRLDLL